MAMIGGTENGHSVGIKMATPRRARRARERARRQHAANAGHESRGSGNGGARRRRKAVGGNGRHPSEGEDRGASSRSGRKRDAPGGLECAPGLGGSSRG